MKKRNLKRMIEKNTEYHERTRFCTFCTVSKIDERTSYTNSSENQESLEYTVGNETSCASAPDTEFCNGPVPPDSAFR